MHQFWNVFLEASIYFFFLVAAASLWQVMFTFAAIAVLPAAHARASRPGRSKWIENVCPSGRRQEVHAVVGYDLPARETTLARRGDPYRLLTFCTVVEKAEKTIKVEYRDWQHCTGGPHGTNYGRIRNVAKEYRSGALGRPRGRANDSGTGGDPGDTRVSIG